MPLTTVDIVNVVADLIVLAVSCILIMGAIVLIIWMEVKTGRNVFNQFHPVRLMMILTFILLQLTPIFTMPPIWERIETYLQFVIPIVIQEIACKINISIQYISELIIFTILLFFLAHRISPKSTTNYEDESEDEEEEDESEEDDSESEEEENDNIEEKELEEETDWKGEKEGMIQQPADLPPLKPQTIPKKPNPKLIDKRTISEKVAHAFQSYHALHFESPVKKNLFILTPAIIISMTLSLVYVFFMILDFLLDTDSSRVLFILFSTQDKGAVGNVSEHVRVCYVPVIPAIYQGCSTALFLIVYAATFSIYMRRIINLKLKHRMTRLQIFIMFFLVLNMLVTIIQIILVVDVWSTIYVHLFSLLTYCLRSITSLCILIGYVIIPVREAINVQNQMNKGTIGYFSLRPSDYHFLNSPTDEESNSSLIKTSPKKTTPQPTTTTPQNNNQVNLKRPSTDLVKGPPSVPPHRASTTSILLSSWDGEATEPGVPTSPTLLQPASNQGSSKPLAIKEQPEYEDEEDQWTDSEEDHSIDEGDTPSKNNGTALNLGPSQTALRFASFVHKE